MSAASRFVRQLCQLYVYIFKLKSCASLTSRPGSWWVIPLSVSGGIFYGCIRAESTVTSSEPP